MSRAAARVLGRGLRAGALRTRSCLPPWRASKARSRRLARAPDWCPRRPPRPSPRSRRGASFDAAALAPAARRAGTLAIPFVKQLTETGRGGIARGGALRALRRHQPGRHRYRRGAMPRLPATERLLALSKRVGDAAAGLAKRHARTPIVARTLLQPAVPVPFGWKAAVWLSHGHAPHAHFAPRRARPACCSSAARAARCRLTAAGRADRAARSLPSSALRARR